MSDSRQSEIDRRFRDIVGAELVADWKQRFPSFNGSAGSALEINRDFFQRARYAFDYVSTAGDGYICGAVKVAVREVILEAEPTWAGAEVEEGVDRLGRKRIALDGKHLVGMQFGPDTVLVLRGILGAVAINQCRFEGCGWSFEGPAGVTIQLLRDIAHSSPAARAYVENMLVSAILGPAPESS